MVNLVAMKVVEDNGEDMVPNIIFFNVLYIRLNSLSSPLQSKAMFINGFYVSFWRALSCQQTPSQALNPEQNHKKRKLQSHNKID